VTVGLCFAQETPNLETCAQGVSPKMKAEIAMKTRIIMIAGIPAVTMTITPE
jgi:hypothetical protein